MGGPRKDACNLTLFWTKEYDNGGRIVPWSMLLFELPNYCQRWNAEITIVSLLLQKMLMKQENRQ